MELLTGAMPRVSLKLPKLHPCVSEELDPEWVTDEAFQDFPRLDSFESEPLLEGVSQDNVVEALVLLPEQALSASPDIEALSVKAQRLAFEAAHRQEAIARKAIRGQSSAKHVAAPLLFAALLSVGLVLALLKRASSVETDCKTGLQIAALSAAFSTSLGLVGAWAIAAGHIFGVLTSVLGEVRMSAVGLLDNAHVEVIGPLRQLEALLDELVAQQQPAIQKLQEFHDVSEAYGFDELRMPLHDCEQLLCTALSTLKADIPERMRCLMASSRSGRIATQRRAFDCYMVLPPMVVASIINLAAALLQVRIEAFILACMGSPAANVGTKAATSFGHAIASAAPAAVGKGMVQRPLAQPLTASVLLAFPLIQMLLCSLHLLTLIRYWRPRRICEFTNRAIAALQRSLNDHINNFIRTAVESVFQDAFRHLRLKAVVLLGQHSDNLRRLHRVSEVRTDVDAK